MRRRKVEINYSDPATEINLNNGALKRCGDILEDIWNFMVNKDGRRSKGVLGEGNIIVGIGTGGEVRKVSWRPTT